MVEADALISSVITDEEISKGETLGTYFTIDPKDAKDFDDALSVSILGDNIEVGIHIAVSHYYKEGTDLEEEAAKEQHQFI
jgi:exoribonuclease R